MLVAALCFNTIHAAVYDGTYNSIALFFISVQQCVGLYKQPFCGAGIIFFRRATFLIHLNEYCSVMTPHQKDCSDFFNSHIQLSHILIFIDKVENINEILAVSV